MGKGALLARASFPLCTLGFVTPLRLSVVVGAIAMTFGVMSARRWFRAVDPGKLGETWAGAVEVMLCENRKPKRNLYLVPASSREEAGPSGGVVPVFVKDSVIFALTAFNPPGNERTLEANTKANQELWKAINMLEPRPLDVWPTWGYNLAEGWREDGFALAFSLQGQTWSLAGSEKQRTAVVQLAKQFKQGGIFEFYYDGVEQSLVRQTVAATLSSQVEETVRVWTVPAPDVTSNAMLARSWAGPEEAFDGLLV